MSQLNRPVRIVAGCVFLLSAVALFFGVVSLGTPTTTVVAAIDLVVGVALLASGLRSGRPRRSAGSY